MSRLQKMPPPLPSMSCMKFMEPLPLPLGMSSSEAGISNEILHPGFLVLVDGKKECDSFLLENWYFIELGAKKKKKI